MIKFINIIILLIFSLILVSCSYDREERRSRYQRNKRNPKSEQLPDSKTKANSKNEFNLENRELLDFQTVNEISDYINSIARSDKERAWYIYCWLAQYISYDAHALSTGKFGDLSPEGVMKSRKGVCSGFSNLYKAIGDRVGLEVEEVSGYSKGYSYIPGQLSSGTNHSWNVVKINGEWILVDATWGQGYVKNENNKLLNVREFNNYWFDTNPKEFIFTHLPEESKWQLIDTKIGMTEFSNLPKVSFLYFTRGLINDDNYNELLDFSNKTIVKNYYVDSDLEIISAPLEYELKKDKLYDFEIICQNAKKVAIINNGNWIHFDKSKKAYKYQGGFEKGELFIAIKLNKRSENYDYILGYQVK